MLKPDFLHKGPPVGQNRSFTSYRTVKAKFHYAVQLASRLQTSVRPNSIKLSSLRPAREKRCAELTVVSDGVVTSWPYFLT